MKTLNIEPRFQEALRPLTEYEITQLRESLRENGCLDPIITWANSEDIIIDGHNRYALCQELGIMFKTKAIALEGQTEVINWIRKNQAARRNLTPNEMTLLLAKEHNADKKAPHAGHNQHTKSGEHHLDAHRKTSAKIAAKHGVSQATVERAVKIAEEADKLPPEEKEAWLRNPKKSKPTNKSQSVLDRLRRGPATASELAIICADYRGAIRKHREDGFSITIVDGLYCLDESAQSNGTPKKKPKLKRKAFIGFKGEGFTPPKDAESALVRIREVIREIKHHVKTSGGGYRLSMNFIAKRMTELEDLTSCFPAPKKQPRHSAGSRNGATT